MPGSHFDNSLTFKGIPGILLCCLTLLGFPGTFSYAQETPPAIAPNRPGLSDGTAVVASGRFLLEMGINYERDDVSEGSFEREFTFWSYPTILLPAVTVGGKLFVSRQRDCRTMPRTFS